MLSHALLLQYLVHFDSSTISAEGLTKQLQSAGVQVSSYIPDDTFLIVVQPNMLSSLQQLPGVSWIGDYLPEYRIAPEAQQLSSFLAKHSAASLTHQQVADMSTANLEARQVHNFIHRGPHGSSYVPLDVSFPHHLPDVLGQLQHALELCNKRNATKQSCSTGTVVRQLDSFYPSHAAAADWEASLNKLCHSQCSFAASGAERLVVDVPIQYLKVVAFLLASDTQTDSMMQVCYLCRLS